ncbi:putative amidoligase enzyme-domain-containing protein [Cladorrhinum sp. PSN259]|nr:putative amidoligase enzyme-domain-containing protein [Cladorrhinum sp. PSN259]
MSLDFGIEIELLLAPHPNAQPNFLATLTRMGWDKTIEGQLRAGRVSNGYMLDNLQNRNRRALRSAVAEALSDADIPASSDCSSEYDVWSVIDDESLDEFPGYWRVELVSRVLSADNDWHIEIDEVFRILRQNCQIRLTSSSSLHVHISPGRNTFNDMQIRSLGKAVIYYDDAITRIMPAERKPNPYAKSNCLPEGKGNSGGQSVNPKIKLLYSQVPAKTFEPLFKALDKVTWRTVCGMMQETKGNVARYVSWNFENITKPCGTLEFRRPPGVDSPARARHWVAFALGFVSRATSDPAYWEAAKTRNHGGSVAELKTFVTGGLQRFPLHCAAALLKIEEDTSKPLILSAEEQLHIEELKARKARTASPFASKASSRANSPSVGRSDSGGWGR